MTEFVYKGIPIYKNGIVVAVQPVRAIQADDGNYYSGVLDIDIRGNEYVYNKYPNKGGIVLPDFTAQTLDSLTKGEWAMGLKFGLKLDNVPMSFSEPFASLPYQNVFLPSPNRLYAVSLLSASPYIVFWKNVSGAWIKLPAPSVLPAATISTIPIWRGDNYVIFQTSTTP